MKLIAYIIVVQIDVENLWVWKIIHWYSSRMIIICQLKVTLTQAFKNTAPATGFPGMITLNILLELTFLI